MAQDPRPRTFPQIVGDIEEGFLSRTGVAGLRVGGSALSAFESFAQSEARQNQDVFAAQNASDPSRLAGDQLDRYGLSRGVRRLPATAATTGVTVRDSRFVRTSTRLSPLRPPPIPGQTTLYVQDAASFGATGSVYVGRGTDTGEGPVAYTSKTDNGSDWSLALSAPVQRRHTGAEEVLLAQGGDRAVAAGTVVRTQQGNALTSASYTITATAAVPDGEVEVRDVQVACTERGTNGNAPAAAIAAFSSLPFPGATVSNPLPVTNGRGVQQDPDYLQDIYRAEASRSRGTPLAIERFALGVQAEDEPRTCLSASFVRHVGPEPDYLTVDDGTGYQPISAGVALEAIVSSARGGEQDFQLVGRPVTKAALSTHAPPPWELLPGDRLAFEVGGVVTEHPLDPAGYLAGADPYAVASDVNSDPLLNWEAVVTDQGRAVLFRARSEFRDDVRSVPPGSGRDAAAVLDVPRQLERTLFLYLDDVALTKDGVPATYASAAFGSWGVLSGSQTWTLAVDGTAPATYTVVDQDFVDARTGYTSVGRNSPAAWAAVLTRKVPGVTVTSTLGRLFTTSNLGTDARARVEVTGGSLVGAGVFAVGSAQGRSSDFVLDRSLGDGRLAAPMAAGQTLTAGSDQIRGFLAASPPASTTFASTATWWVALDAAALAVGTGLTPASSFAGTVGAGALRAWGGRLRLTVAAGAFSSVLGGDFVVFWDPTAPSTLSGQWLVAQVAPDGSWVDLDRPEGRWARYWAGSCVLTDGRIFVAGGYSAVSRDCPTDTAETYDPATGLWTYAGAMAVPRAECWAVALPGNKVLVGGGFLGVPEVWSAGTFTPTSATDAPPLAVGQAAVLNGDGLVYVAGGLTVASAFQAVVRSYNHVTDAWGVVASMATPRHRLAMVSYGTLLWVTAGLTTASVVTTDSEWFDPGTGLWTTEAGVGARWGHAMSVTGTDIVVSGGNSAGTEAPTRLSDTVLLVAGAPPWVAGPAMTVARAYHRQVTLSGGKILIAGGEAAASPADLYDPAGPAIAATGTPLLSPRAAPLLASTGTNAALLGFGGLPVSGADFGQPTASSERWTLAGATWAASDPVAGTSFSLTGGGVAFGRAGDRVRKYSLGVATTLTATALATALQVQLAGGDAGSTAATSRTTRLRWRTNTHASRSEVANSQPPGDIYLAAANPQAQLVPFPAEERVESGEGQAGWVLSGPELGTPEFEGLMVLGSGVVATPSVSWAGIEVAGRRPTPSHFLVGLGGMADTYALTRWGQGRGYASQFSSGTYLPSFGASRTSMRLALRSGPEQGYAPLDRAYFAAPWALGAYDQLVVVANRDPEHLRTTLNTYRRLVPTSNVYGQTITVQDGDLSPVASLGTSFGIDYDFTDHAVLMRARGKTHAADASKRVLWRWWRHGEEGEWATITYAAPVTPSTPVEVAVDDVSGPKTDVSVRLAAGALKTGPTLRTTTRLGLAAISTSTGVSSLVIACGVSITSAVRAANVTTLTLALPTGITNHGLVVGNVVYVTSNSVNFSAGTKTITVVTATTIKYAEVAADAGPDANIGTVSYDPVGEASFATFAPALAVSDWVRVDSAATGVAAAFRSRTFRLTGSGGQVLYARATDYSSGTSTTLSWQQLLNPAFLLVFANPAQSVGTIVTAVATLVAAGNSPVQPTITGTGAGTIDRSSADEAGVSPTTSPLYDGRNAVASQSAPVIPANNYSFTLKDAVEPSIASDADWQGEDVRLAPVTAPNVARWLRAAAVSGLFPSVLAEVAGRGRRVQLAATTFGAAGAVQVQGGSANEWAAPVVGPSEIADGGAAMVSPISVQDVAGFASSGWVVAQLGTPAPRDAVAATTSLLALTTSGKLSVTGGSPQLWSGSSLFSNTSVTVERCGNFVKYTDAGLGTAFSVGTEGDTVFVSVPAAPTPGVPSIATANAGAFQVVRSGGGFVWVEAASQVDQLACQADIRYVSQGSVKPGDVLTIGTDLWGADNAGTWVVTGIGDGGGGPFTDARTVNLDVSTRSPRVQTGPIPLGAAFELVRFAPPVPQRWIKRVRSISVYNGPDARVRLEAGGGVEQISAAHATTLVALDKLGFPAETSQGRDAYDYNVGLVGAVNRVEYGDSSDPVTFPGVVSADAEVRVDGPRIRRTRFAVAVRLRQGFSPPDVEGAIRSAVAAAVASRPHGQPIPVSDLLREVSRVGGVESVVPLSPYNSTEDSIPVLPGERALVLDLQRDVQVSYL